MILATALALLGCGEDERVKVPDVTGQRVLDARRTISKVGLSSRLDPNPRAPAACRVTDQSKRGLVAEGTDVVLRVSCPRRLDEGED